MDGLGDGGSSAGVRGPSVETVEAEERSPRDKLGSGEARGHGERLKSLLEFDLETSKERICSGGSWMSTGCCFFDLEPKPITAARLNLDDDFEDIKAL